MKRGIDAIAALCAAAAIAACTAALPSAAPAPPTAAPAPNPAPSTATAPARDRGGTMVVRFLDVGQGDSAIVTTDDRHAMLVDAGPPEANERVMRALAAVGDAALDLMVLTHAHADHMGRLAEILSGGRFGSFAEPGIAPPHASAYDRAVGGAGRAHVVHKTVRRGSRFELGGHVEVTVLAPREPLLSHTRSDLNANSVVLRVDHHALANDVRILFEGDAEEPTEKRLLEHPDELRADVLKVAHHGSRFASSEPLLAAVSPRLAVISCGRGNDYGHPHARTLRHLEQAAGAVARTDLEGDVTVTSDDRGLNWTAARAATAAELRSPGVGVREERAP